MSETALAVDRLSFTYAGRESPTLVDISFSLEPGGWNVLAGASGSGKSTLLRALAGLIPRHSAGRMEGGVKLFGHDTRTCNAQQVASLAGLVLQAPDDQICTTSVTAEIAFGLENLALDVREIDVRVAEALERLNMAGDGWRSTQQLSGGQKQRLLLSSIMAMRPGVLLLDEPLSQLDAAAAADLLAELARLRQKGLTILFVEHRLDEVLEYADRVLVIDRGRLTADVAPGDREQLCNALAAAGLPLPEVTQLSQAVDCAAAISAEEFCRAMEGRTPASAESAAAETMRQTSETPLVRVKDLALRYPRAARPVLADVSFEIRTGERIAVVGPNGSGKSTLLAALAGIMRPVGGGILPADPQSWRTPGLMLQNPDLTLFCNSVQEELAFGPQQARRARDETDAIIAEVATLFDLDAVLSEPPLALSQGQRLRVAVAALLTLQPQLLLLDEPTTGQDQLLVARLLEAATKAVEAERIGALVFSTHDLRSVATYADRVLVLADGKLLADGSPGRLLDDDELLAASGLRRPPLFEVRRRLGLHGRNVAELAEELRP